MDGANACDPFLNEMEAHMLNEGDSPASLQTALERILDHFGCAVGTIHALDAGTGLLRLRAQRGVPPTILAQIQAIPMGKGMAGLAAKSCVPIKACNLQTDASGVAKTGAKETNMGGSMAVPMLVENQPRGVLGVAKPAVYEFSEAETALLLAIAGTIGKYFGETVGGRG